MPFDYVRLMHGNNRETQNLKPMQKTQDLWGPGKPYSIRESLLSQWRNQPQSEIIFELSARC